MASNKTYMTPSPYPKNRTPGDNIKPTILAFHGSGSNATIHTVQLARLMRVIRPYFNVENLEAPFPSPAGPGVLPFFDGCGPYKRWLPPSSKVSTAEMKSGTTTSIMPPEVQSHIRDTVRKIHAAGGKVAGLIGFSQGTKILAGLLEACEVLRQKRERGEDVPQDLDWLDFSFALVVCGSYKPPLLPPVVSSLLTSSSLPLGLASPAASQAREVKTGVKITVPTFHVLGNEDEWKWAGESLIEAHFEVEEDMSVVREWTMGHHYPTAPEESEDIGEWMIAQWRKKEGQDL